MSTEKQVYSFKIRIYPTAEQREYFAKAFGIRRWVWNWACATFFERAKQDKFPTSYDLQKELNNTLAKDENYAWLNDVTSMIRQESLKDFGLAIKAYAHARHEAKRTNEKCDIEKYKPNFKKKGKCSESARWMHKDKNSFKIVSKHHFSLVRVRGEAPLKLRTAANIGFLKNTTFCTCTISYSAGRYYACITYKKTNCREQTQSGKIGLDLGIKHVCATFDGTNGKVFDLPKSLFEAEKRRERINVLFSRTQKGSNRHEKLKLRLQSAYERENNIKKEFREQTTFWLASNYQTVVVDDFSFAASLNLRNCTRALHRVGSYTFKERLKTKLRDFGGQLVVIPKFTPTTQTCSHCGALPTEKVELSDRTYTCEHCGFTIDRDLNAAINAYNYI